MSILTSILTGGLGSLVGGIVGGVTASKKKKRAEEENRKREILNSLSPLTGKTTELIDTSNMDPGFTGALKGAYSGAQTGVGLANAINSATASTLTSEQKTMFDQLIKTDPAKAKSYLDAVTTRNAMSQFKV